MVPEILGWRAFGGEGRMGGSSIRFLMNSQDPGYLTYRCIETRRDTDGLIEFFLVMYILSVNYMSKVVIHVQ